MSIDFDSVKTLNTVVLDFETFHDDEYSLRKMTPVEYVLDARFESLGVAVIVNDETPFWVDGPALPAFVSSMPWDRIYAYSHNALFDFAVLKWRYNVLPAAIGDTLAMARAHLQHVSASISLAKLAEYYGLPAKGGTLRKMKGVGFDALRSYPGLYEETKTYAAHDAWLCKTIYELIMSQGFPPDQLELIDMQIRMCVQPKLVLNQTILSEHLSRVMAHKEQLLQQCGLLSRDDLMSNERFAQLLIDAGVVDLPYKISKATGEITYAFARTDKAFTDLENHENPQVQALVAARLGHKSTMEETRTQRFLAISHLPWLNERPRSMPIPLKFSGAHTHRFSGDWLLNAQNLKRGKTQEEAELRYALEAPDENHVVVSADASQIEARITATLCGQTDLIAGFEAGEDVYASYASDLFGYPVNKVEHPMERFCGKTSILSLGYGSGWATYQNMIRVQSGGKVILDDDTASRQTKFYRKRMRNISNMWGWLDKALYSMRNGDEFWIGPVLAKGTILYLPNGMTINYRNLHTDNKYGKEQWYYAFGRQEKTVYGVKVLENVVQALAFVMIMEAARRIKRLTEGLLMPQHQVHDELIYVVPRHIARPVADLCIEEISRRPGWMPSVPLAAEASWGSSYGAAKAAG